MRARDLDVPPGAGAEYGLAQGLVGIGPGGGEKAGRTVHRFASLPDGVFVWTRDRDGRFHLGRLAGDMHEVDSAEARAVGITHVRAAEWLDRSFGESEVPPAVSRTFARGGRNLQRTHDTDAEILTARLWSG